MTPVDQKAVLPILQARVSKHDATPSHEGSRKRKTTEYEGKRCHVPDPVAKGRLHDVCMQFLGRELDVGDIVYRMLTAPCGGEVAVLELPTLPGALGKTTWRSSPCSNRRLARLQAAEVALRALVGDFDISAAIPIPPDFEGDPVSSAPSADERSASNSDVKTEVVIFCQRRCGRPMTKNDIVYTTIRQEGAFQSTVQLCCLEGEEFAGSLRPDRRQAERAAAEEVLKAFAKERATMLVAAESKRRKILDDDVCQEIDPDVKRKLHEACSRILGRPPQAGDVVYEVALSNHEPTVTLRLPGLAHVLGSDRVWTSPPCGSRHDARLQVAGMALRAILEDPDIGPLAAGLRS
eukprot:TRINITY_DN58282_c0_g1_i1.p1 TRINITY_DN58282_c0_g1~~TRINITY_DN58282_c0_g1_i1.p1  ORF type:complete len:384 (-),score=66.81 TRINITY_DN58282_c0_g1_i1:75-1124(-)